MSPNVPATTVHVLDLICNGHHLQKASYAQEDFTSSSCWLLPCNVARNQNDCNDSPSLAPYSDAIDR